MKPYDRGRGNPIWYMYRTGTCVELWACTTDTYKFAVAVDIELYVIHAL